jgi:hypothetical protein
MIARLMGELQRQGRYTIDDIAQAIAARLQVWAPGREEMLRHLTQRQAIRLLNDDRLERAIRLNADLQADDLSGSVVLPNARVLLTELVEVGGAKLTEVGFLNRKFVMQIGGKFNWPDYDWQELCRYSKSVREAEVTPLNFLHGVLRLGGMIHARRGVLRVGKRGRELIPSERAGALQTALFRTAWCDLDLADFAGLALGRELQRQANLILFMINRLADDWIDSERLLHAAIVPDQEILAAPEHLPTYALEGSFLRPLRWFGLIETRTLPAESGWRSRRELRKTSLYDRFLAFDAGPA